MLYETLPKKERNVTKTEVMRIPVIPALKREDVRFQAWLHSEILSQKEMGERERNKEAER